MTAAPQLDSVQSFLQEAFRLPGPIPGDPALEARAAQHVKGNDRLTPAEQADIYRRQFFLRHVDSLAEDHLGVAHYLGEDGFEELARAYLERHPPRTPSLRDLGADLATFLETYDGVPEPLRELCLDMTRYELCSVELFDAPDAPPIDVKRLAAVPQYAWLTRPLVFTPLLRLLALGYPVIDLRIAIKKGDASKEPPPREEVYYGVFRRDDIISFERIGREAHELLRLLLDGQPLASACEALSQRLSDERASMVEAEVGTWFQRWASWGWILDVKEQ